LDEIDRLKEELHDCDETINKRKSDITALESVIAESFKGLNHFKLERDKLNLERKYVIVLLLSPFFFFLFFSYIFFFFYYYFFK